MFLVYENGINCINLTTICRMKIMEDNEGEKRIINVVMTIPDEERCRTEVMDITCVTPAAAKTVLRVISDILTGYGDGNMDKYYDCRSSVKDISEFVQSGYC